jgi:hypothetical protein
MKVSGLPGPVGSGKPDADFVDALEKVMHAAIKRKRID